MLISPVSCQRLTHSGKDEVLCLNAFGRKKFKCKIKGFSFIKHFVSFLAECSIKRSASPPRSSPPTATVQIPGGWYLAGLSQVDHHHRWSGGSSTSLRISAPSPPLQCQWTHMLKYHWKPHRSRYYSNPLQELFWPLVFLPGLYFFFLIQ